ncbi:MAG: undecaprenyl-diphosphate phosphatase [Candidatus Pacebacteria bacterium]|nr:undecaprenyl-diphosphate phosphatase [Candidatus Paceibacterota bacterium]MCD8528379.1 undecaprenyl-diphosphate phosphatase [Candidatus Paceibacterota bacterium]MCD8563677.1 undecaprenyl-diphosphate phosphatase [Candidatus Paceibacterota bacterium]
MSFFHIIILSIVEGVTEFLPVSSTGHLMIAAQLLGIDASTFLSTLIIALQLGAIGAVVFLYGKDLLTDRALMRRLIYATIPTAIIGVIVYPFLGYLLTHALIPIIALGVGGIIMILVEIHVRHIRARDIVQEITPRQSIALGFFQAIAFIPGVSRSASTIIGGLLVGVERVTITRFSFLMAVPLMVIATLYDLAHVSWSFSGNEWSMLGVGMLIAGLVAYGAMKLLLAFVARYSFIPFGVYRIIFALCMFVFWYM